ncbi:MAG: NADPH-dependent F420 reductase [Archaeoglobaceae archaeon]
MRIAILGGTGNLGIGLSLRLAIAGYEVVVGSRSEEKAIARAEEYKNLLSKKGYVGKITGAQNLFAAEICDIAIITVPWENAFSLAEKLKSALADKIVLSPLVPMKKEGKFFRYVELPEGSASEKIAGILNESKIVAAFQNIPAERFADLDAKFEWDVVVCGDETDAKRKVIEIINQIKGLRALDAGDLQISRITERLTVLILNIMATNRFGEISVKFC